MRKAKMDRAPATAPDARRADVLLAGQNRALELIASGAPLPEVLDALARFIEAQGTGGLCSVLVVEDGRLRLGAAPSLPDAYNRLVDGIPIGPAMGACGTAAFTGEPQVTEEIATDPRWTPFCAIVAAARDAGLASCWSTPIRGGNGAVLGTFAFYYDTPSRPRVADLRLVGIATHLAGIAIERHQAARALEERADRLSEASHRKDEFLALLAHELRNPLAPIITALGLLQGHEGDRVLVTRCRGVIDRQTRQLVRLVDDLLDVSRVTRGKIVLRPERITLGAALRSALEASAPIVHARGHEVRVLLPDEPLELDADPVRVAQVLSNLLNNAAKYTDPGGHIEVRGRREGDEVVLSVRDDGIGVPPEMLARIFDPFTQVEAARGQAQGGLGIGLMLVKRLVELHGGHVEAQSEGPGRGTEVTVCFPAATGPAPEVSAPRAAASPSPPRRVLIIDDNIDAAESLADALRDAGHEVLVEGDGPSALAAAPDFQPQVALVDIGLPGMDGYEVARRLRAAPPAPRLVALSGYGQDADQRRAREAGFDAYLVKPADLDRIEAVLAG